MTEDILMLAAAATTLVKVIVDMLRLAFPNRPSWVSPVLAVVLGPPVTLLLMIANGNAVTEVLVAQAAVAGILAGGAAIGVTEAQRRAV